MAHQRPSWRSGYSIFLLPSLVLCLIVIILPFLTTIGASFTRWTGVGIPLWVGAANYQKLLEDTTFWTSFRNNLAVIIAMTVIPTLIGLVLSMILVDYVARRFGQRVSNIFRVCFYAPQVMPVVILGMAWGWILHPQEGALNSLLHAVGLGSLARNWLGEPATALSAVMGIMIWFQIGYPLVIFMAALQRIDPEMLEAAIIDGATISQRFAYITVPLIRPEIFVVVLTTMIHALKIFAPIYVLTRGGPGRATIIPAYFGYLNFFEKSNVGYGSVITTIMTAIIVLLMVVFIRVQSQQELREDT